MSKHPQVDSSVHAFRRERADQLRWLLRFSQRNLTQIPESEWDDLPKGLELFAVRLMGVGGVWPLSVLTDGFRLVRGFGGVPARLPRPLTREEILSLHRELRRLLGELRPMEPFAPVNDWTAAAVAFPRVTIPARIQRIDLTWNLGREAHEITSVYGAEWPDWLWLAIAAVLKEFGPWIVRCEAQDCRRLFLRTRRQAYCSPECSQRVRSKRWYEAHQDKAREQRREAYQDEVRRKSYAKAKVQRRKRRAK